MSAQRNCAGASSARAVDARTVRRGRAGRGAWTRRVRVARAAQGLSPAPPYEINSDAMPTARQRRRRPSTGRCRWWRTAPATRRRHAHHLRVFHVLELATVAAWRSLVQQRGRRRAVDRLRLGDAVHAQRRREGDRELVALLALKEFGVHVDQELDLVGDALAPEAVTFSNLALRVDGATSKSWKTTPAIASRRLRHRGTRPRRRQQVSALCRCCGSGVPYVRPACS